MNLKGGLFIAKVVAGVAYPPLGIFMINSHFCKELTDEMLKDANEPTARACKRFGRIMNFTLGTLDLND